MSNLTGNDVDSSGSDRRHTWQAWFEDEETVIPLVISGICVGLALIGILSSGAFSTRFSDALVDIITFANVVNIGATSATRLSKSDGFIRSANPLQIFVWTCPICIYIVVDVLSEMSPIEFGIELMLTVGRAAIVCFCSTIWMAGVFGIMAILLGAAIYRAIELLGWRAWKSVATLLILLCGCIVLYGVDSRPDLWKTWHPLPGMNSVWFVLIGTYFSMIMMWIIVALRKFIRLGFNLMIRLH